MAYRNYSNVIGDRGELRCMIQLLDTGAAINSLTGSDTGWDLHLHLPQTPVAKMPGGLLLETQEGWPLSGRSIHVQVKAGNSVPCFNVGTMRGWIESTKGGSPSFVCQVTDDEKSEIKIIDPAEIHLLLQNENLVNLTIEADKEKNSILLPNMVNDAEHIRSTYLTSRTFEVRSFSLKADLYIKYPYLMVEQGVSIDKLAYEDETTDSAMITVCNLLSEMGAGYMFTCNQYNTEDYEIHNLVNVLVEHFYTSETTVDLHNIKQMILAGNGGLDTPSLEMGWTNAGISPALYSRKSGAEAILGDLKDCLSSIREFINAVKRPIASGNDWDDAPQANAT